jgi:hypothetical protein
MTTMTLETLKKRIEEGEYLTQLLCDEIDYRDLDKAAMEVLMMADRERAWRRHKVTE